MKVKSHEVAPLSKKMKYLNKIKYLIILFPLTLPSFVQAMYNPNDPLIPCNPKNPHIVNGQTVWDNPCDFTALVRGVGNLIDFALYLAAPIATAMFAYAGFLYLSAQGDTGKITTAHKIFKNVAFGLFFVVGAWLIVKAVLIGLGAESSGLLNLQ